MKPYKFQTEVIQEINQFDGRALVACDPGLGKTPISLWWIAQNAQKALPAVVICPASVKYHWEMESRKCGVTDYEVLEGRRTSRIRPAPLVILNYDILIYWLEELKKLRPRTIVLDESAYIQSPTTKRTKATQELCKGVPHILALSGTPLVNRPIELFPTLQILQPALFRSRFNFGRAFCNGHMGPFGWDFRGASNTGKLHKLLMRNLMIRRRKAEVLKDLPPKIRRVVTVPLHNPQEYHRASTDFMNWLRDTDPAALDGAFKAQTLVKIGYLLRLAAKLKLKALIEWINDFLDDSDEKLVVFAVHHKMIDALKRRIDAECVVIDGRVPSSQRGFIVEQFQRNKKVRVLVGNIRAAGVGLTLTAASNVVFAELPWTPGAVTQSEDRCHRISAKGQVFIWFLISQGTIEERLCKLLQSKQEVLSSVLDGGPVSGDLDVYSQLMKSFLKGNGR
jgi:SWI/SNF-related matrix-associated actin-dependent regulator 1 of chromatin subfamily A